MGEGFYPAAQQIQQPDILGQYLRGRAAPMQMEAMQQENTLGGLKIDQLRQILQGQQLMAQAWEPSGVPQEAPQGGVGAGASPMGVPPQGSTYAGAQPGLSAPTQAIIGSLSPNMGKLLTGTAMTGGDPFAKAKEAQENQLQQGRLQWGMDNTPGGEGFLRQMATSPDAPQVLQSNMRTLGPIWAQAAFAAGVDARDMSPHNVNKVAASLYNQRAIPLGMPPIAAPAHFAQESIGQGGTQQVNVDTGETKPGISREAPGFTTEKVQNPDGTQSVVKVQTSGWGAGGSGVAGGGGPSTAGINIGRPAPTEANVKQAGFAATMQGGLQGLRALEAKGFALTPSQRAQLIDMATNENPGMLHQFISQQVLNKWGSQAKQYLTSMMPVIQAVSHDQAGARVTPSQLRLNLESVIPVDAKDAGVMAQVNQTRDNFQKAMNVGAGPAAYAPEFRNTIGAQREAAAASATPPQVGQIVKGHKFLGGDPSQKSSWAKL